MRRWQLLERLRRIGSASFRACRALQQFFPAREPLDPPSTELRQVIIRSTDTGNICEPAHGDIRTGWEPFLEETLWLIALTRPDTPDEAS